LGALLPVKYAQKVTQIQKNRKAQVKKNYQRLFATLYSSPYSIIFFSYILFKVFIKNKTPSNSLGLTDE
jgi:hypothetical protein